MNQGKNGLLLVVALICLVFTISNAYASEKIIILGTDEHQYVNGDDINVKALVIDYNSGGALNYTSIILNVTGPNGYRNDTSSTTDSEGKFSLWLANISNIGSYNVTASSGADSSQIIFEVSNYSSFVWYEIRTSTLSTSAGGSVPIKINKYVRDVLTNDTIILSLYYQNSSSSLFIANRTIVSGIETNITLSSLIGLYKLVFNDGKNIIMASVDQYSLKYKIMDSSKKLKNTFSPSENVYFEITAYSNSVLLSNATCKITITKPSGSTSFLTCLESAGVYTSRTTESLLSGKYGVEISFTSQSGVEQKLYGFFDVVSLGVTAAYDANKVYSPQDRLLADLAVLNLNDGSVYNYSEVTFDVIANVDGKDVPLSQDLYTNAVSTKTTATSFLNLSLPPKQGKYKIKVVAKKEGATGETVITFEVRSVDVFANLVGKFDEIKEIVNVGESVKFKLSTSDNSNITWANLTSITNSQGTEFLSREAVMQNREIAFNAPSSEGDYLAKIVFSLDGTTRQTIYKWFKVKSYSTFPIFYDSTGAENAKYDQTSNITAKIVVESISSASTVDLSNFVFTINSIKNKDSGKTITSVKSILNSGNKTSGYVTYTLYDLNLGQGFYELSYNVIDATGTKITGVGSFEILPRLATFKIMNSNKVLTQSFVVNEKIYINVSAQANSNITIYRQFYSNKQNITNAQGYAMIVLDPALGEVESKDGKYPFSIGVLSNDSLNYQKIDGFYDIKTTYIDSISVASNGNFDYGNEVTFNVLIKSGADVKSAEMVFIKKLFDKKTSKITYRNDTNITGTNGKAYFNFGQIEAGEYLCDVEIKDGSQIKSKQFSFNVLENSVTVSRNSQYSEFTKTGTLEFKVKVAMQNGSAKSNVNVSLYGLMDLETYLPILASENPSKFSKTSATTGSNGETTQLAVSLANLNKGRYVPIIKVGTSDKYIVGSDAEFKVKAFDADVIFAENKNTYTGGENVLFNVTSSSDPSMVLESMFGFYVPVSPTYNSNSKQIRVRTNELMPGPYVLTVTITSGSDVFTKKLSFEITQKFAFVAPMQSNDIFSGNNVSINITMQETSPSGPVISNGTINVSKLINMWTQNETVLNNVINITGNQIYNYNTAGLSEGDYVLVLRMPSNPMYRFDQFFRVISPSSLSVMQSANVLYQNVSITINVSQQANITFERLTNWDTFTTNSTPFSKRNVAASTSYNISNLALGYYEAAFIVESGVQRRFIFVQFPVFEKAQTGGTDITSIINKSSTIVDENGNITINFTKGSDLSSPDTNKIFIIDTRKNKIIATFSGNSSTEFNFIFAEPSEYLIGYGQNNFDAFKQGRNFGVSVNQLTANSFVENMRPRFMNNSKINITFDYSQSLNGSSVYVTLKNVNTYQKIIRQIGVIDNASCFFYCRDTIEMDLSSFNVLEGFFDTEISIRSSATKSYNNYFFMEIVPTGNSYNFNFYQDRFETRTGESILIFPNVYDIINNQNVDADNMTFDGYLYGPSGQKTISTYTNSSGNITITVPSNFISGHYEGSFNISKGAMKKEFRFGFFVRGADNLFIEFNQNKWMAVANEEIPFNFKVFDMGNPRAGVSITVDRVELAPDYVMGPQQFNWTLIGSGNYSSNSNVTGFDGRARMLLNVSNMQKGQYTAVFNVGGQEFYTGFEVKNLYVYSYPLSPEYGKTETMEVVIKAERTDGTKDIDANITFVKGQYMKFTSNGQPPQPTDITEANISFVYERNNSLPVMYDGMGTIQFNIVESKLNITNFGGLDLIFAINYSGGFEYVHSWVSVSPYSLPSISFINETGGDIDEVYKGESYNISIENADSARLLYQYGPNYQDFTMGQPNQFVLASDNESLILEYDVPSMSGYYTLDIEINASGMIMRKQLDFSLGGDLQFNIFVNDNPTRIRPNSTVDIYAQIMGMIEECPGGPQCFSYFGPIGNKTIWLSKIYDDDGNELPFTPMNATTLTNNFMNQQQQEQCNYADSGTCEADTFCKWVGSCITKQAFCQAPNLQEATNCTFGGASASCAWNGGACMYNGTMPQMQNQGGGMMMGPFNMPGVAHFELDTKAKNLGAGDYELLFEYINGNTTSTQSFFMSIEDKHITFVTKRDVAPKANEKMWVKVTNQEGVPEPNCTVSLGNVNDETTWSVVKTFTDAIALTDNSGNAEINFTTPGNTGRYIVEVAVTCGIKTQRSEFTINVPKLTMKVEMSNSVKNGQPIKMLIKTQDKLGEPKSQKVVIEMMHQRDDYDMTVYSLGGDDCELIHARSPMQNYQMMGPNMGPQDPNAQGNQMSSQDMAQLQVMKTTDENGVLELNICPMPEGSYEVNVFPDYSQDFDPSMNGPKQFDNNQMGFYGIVSVSSIDFTIDATMFNGKPMYKAGDNIQINVTMRDEFGAFLENATVQLVEASVSSMGEMSGFYTLVSNETQQGQTSLYNATTGRFSFYITIPATATKILDNGSEMSGVFYPAGPLEILILIKDKDNKYHEYYTVIGALAKLNTSVSTASSADVSSLVQISLNTTGLGLKIPFVAFVNKESDYQEESKIDGDVYVAPNGLATFKVFTPTQPGNYYAVVMFIQKNQTMQQDTEITELSMGTITIKQDYVNVSGNLNAPNAIINIGGKEVKADLSGRFSMQVLKNAIAKVEITYQDGTGYKTTPVFFNESKNITAQTYSMPSAFGLTNPQINLSIPQDTSSAGFANYNNQYNKLRATVSVQNLGLRNLTNATFKISTSYQSLKFNQTIIIGDTFNANISSLYGGFMKSGASDLKMEFESRAINPSGIIDVTNTLGVGSSVFNISVVVKKKVSFSVTNNGWKEGDGYDNDGDGRTDEEKANGKDDDNDGLIDEDIEQPPFISGGFCGDDICKMEEKASCFEDCAGATTFCGDGQCSNSEQYGTGFCAADCGGSNITAECFPKTCFGNDYWCNGQGKKVLIGLDFVGEVAESCNMCGYSISNASRCHYNCDNAHCFACTQGECGSGAANMCQIKSWYDSYLGQNKTECSIVENCDFSSPWNCHSSGECTGIGLNWVPDQYAPNGGRCEKPFICANECGACTNETACTTTSASMFDWIQQKNLTCVWKQTEGCKWNYTTGAQNPNSIIQNIWLSYSRLNNATPGTVFVPIDNWGYSGNSYFIDEVNKTFYVGVGVQYNMYFLSVWIANTTNFSNWAPYFFENITQATHGDGSRPIFTNKTYTFTSGQSYKIMVRDNIMSCALVGGSSSCEPDRIWEIFMGEYEPPTLINKSGATELTLNVSANGTNLLDDVLFYKFNASTGQNLSVKVYQTGNNLDFGLYNYSANTTENSFRYKWVNSGYSDINFTANYNGWYYVMIENLMASPINYSIIVEERIVTVPQTYTVIGRVVYPDMTPVQNVSFRIQNMSGWAISGQASNQTGYYKLEGVQQGIYSLVLNFNETTRNLTTVEVFDVNISNNIFVGDIIMNRIDMNFNPKPSMVMNGSMQSFNISIFNKETVPMSNYNTTIKLIELPNFVRSQSSNAPEMINLSQNIIARNMNIQLSSSFTGIIEASISKSRQINITPIGQVSSSEYYNTRQFGVFANVSGAGPTYSFDLLSILQTWTINNGTGITNLSFLINNTGSMDGYNIALFGNATQLVLGWNTTFTAVPTNSIRQPYIFFNNTNPSQAGKYLLVINVTSMNDITKSQIRTVNITVNVTAGGPTYSFEVIYVPPSWSYSVDSGTSMMSFAINNTASMDGYNVSLFGNATALVLGWNQSFVGVPTGSTRQVNVLFNNTTPQQVGNYILVVNVSSLNNPSLTQQRIINITVMRELINNSINMSGILKINSTPIMQSVSSMSSPWYNISTIVPNNYNITMNVVFYLDNNMSMEACEFAFYNNSATYLDQSMNTLQINGTGVYVLPFTSAYNGSYYAVLDNYGAANQINYTIGVFN